MPGYFHIMQLTCTLRVNTTISMVTSLLCFTQIHLCDEDMAALTGSGSSSNNKTSLLFLYNVTKDNINVCQTCNLIFSLVRNNPDLAEQVAGMVFYGVKQSDFSMHFFRLLTLLTEFSGGPSGMPCFTNLVMHKVSVKATMLGC